MSLRCSVLFMTTYSPSVKDGYRQSRGRRPKTKPHRRLHSRASLYPRDPGAAPLAERVNWTIDNRAQIPAMGACGRERAIEYYAAERNYPQLLDTLAEVVQKPVLAGNGVMGYGFWTTGDAGVALLFA